jgi:hypothetical protein
MKKPFILYFTAITLLFGLSLTVFAQTNSNGYFNGPSCLGPGQQSGEDNNQPFIQSPLSVKIRRDNPNGNNFFKSLGKSYSLQDASNCSTAISGAQNLMSQLNAVGRLCQGALSTAQYSCTPNFMNYPTICATGVTAKVEDTWTIKVTFTCN